MPVTAPVGQTGHGVTLSYDAAGGTSFTALPRISTMNELDAGEPELIDAGHLGFADKIKRVICGEVDPGSLDVECIYKKADFVTLSALWRSETVNWQISIPDPGGTPLVMTFPAILTKKPVGPFERGALVMMKFSIKINGPIT